MVTLVEDELHFTGEHAVFFIVQQDYPVETDRHLCLRSLCGTVFQGQTFKAASQEFHMGFVHNGCFKRVFRTFLLHDVNIKRLHQQAYFISHREAMIVLHHQFVVPAKYGHFVVYALENARLYYAAQLGCIRHREDIQVFRTDHYIHRLVLSKAFIHTFEIVSAEVHQSVPDHGSVQDVTFADKIGYKRIDRFVVDVSRRADLLDLSFAHHHNAVAQCKGLFLIVSDIYEGNAQRLVHFLQFHLHVLAHLQVESSQRFVEQQHFRFVDNGTGYRYTLLLTARQGIDVAVFVVGHAHHLQGSLDLTFHFGLGHFFQLQSESDIVKDIQMREKCIFLKHRIDLPKRSESLQSGATKWSFRIRKDPVW